MNREPWKSLRWVYPPPITPEQAHSIIMGVGFKMGLIETKPEGEGKDLKVVVLEHQYVGEEFHLESLAKGVYLPWDTKAWMVDVLVEKLLLSREEALSLASYRW